MSPSLPEASRRAPPPLYGQPARSVHQRALDQQGSSGLAGSHDHDPAAPDLLHPDPCHPPRRAGGRIVDRREYPPLRSSICRCLRSFSTAQDGLASFHVPLREASVRERSAPTAPEANLTNSFDPAEPARRPLLQFELKLSYDYYDFHPTGCQPAQRAARSIAAAISRSITGRGLSGSIGSATVVTSFVCGSQWTGP